MILMTVLISFSSCNNSDEKKINPDNIVNKMRIKKEKFGQVGNEQVDLYTLTNGNGMMVKITNYGGIITSIEVPDKNGDTDDVVLGFDNLADYRKESPYFGAIVGRYANRIAAGHFTLDGKEYHLAINNGNNHLHGGLKGFDKVIWKATEIRNENNIGLQLSYMSKDMEEGYPGNLNVKVKYLLDKNNNLKVEYEATTDKPTYVNLSQHSYFNLAGKSGRDILDQYLWIDADRYTVVDKELIPIGELRSVTGTPMDFTRPLPIGGRIENVPGGYDHNYVLNSGDSLAKVAEVIDSVSGRKMEVFTNEPGIQFYSGNFLDGSITGKYGVVYRKNFGLCLEAQHFPDSPNHPEFPSTLLKPGEIYMQETVYKFGIIQ